MLAAILIAAEMLTNPHLEGADSSGKITGWSKPSRHYQYVTSGGFDGSGCLTYENADETDYYALPSQIIPVGPGRKYLMTAWAKSGLTSGQVNACFEWVDSSDKYISGRYISLGDVAQGTDGGWHQMTIVTPRMPDSAVRAHVTLYCSRGALGTARWDEVSVTRIIEPAVPGFCTDAYRETAADSDPPVTFRGVLNLADYDLTESEVRADLSWTDAGGAPRRIEVADIAANVATAAVPVSDLATGPVTFRLYRRSDGSELGSRSLVFTRLASYPATGVRVDRRNRLVVDGKPFFPIGMYWSGVTADQLDEYVQGGPFNCLMAYNTPSKNALDLCAARGVRVAFSVKDIYPFKSNGAYPTREAADAKVAQLLAYAKDHPATLCYYVNDEVGLQEADELTHRYEQVRGIDPNHPTWAVLFQYDEFRGYMPTSDILGSDPYPTGTNEFGKCYRWVRTQCDQVFDSRPQWQAVQVHDHGAYSLSDEAKAAATSVPTLGEIRNMTWQILAAGAEGVFFYSHFDLKRMDWKTPFSESFGRVCTVARELKGLERFFLSESPAPVLEGLPNGMTARMWTCGRERLLAIVNADWKPVRTTLDLGDDYNVVATEVGRPLAVSAGKVDVALDETGLSVMRLWKTSDLGVKEFTGASADLNSPANWGGELPGPADIAVIDVAKLPSGLATLTMSNTLEVAGLRVEHNDRNLVIAPVGETHPVLSFGRYGFTNSVDVMDFEKGVGFKVPLSVCCAQTWNCGKQNFTTWSTISGSDTLTFVNAAFIIHYEAVRYGGKIRYNCPNISSAWQWTTSVRAYSGDLWAAELELACNGWLCLTNRTSWSRLFSKRSVVTTASFGLNIRCPDQDGNPGKLVGTVDFGDGDRFESTGASGTSHGFLNIAGGEWNTSGELNAGYFGYYYGTWYPYDYPGVVSITGGKVNGSGAFVGHYCTTAHSNYYHIVQSGGDVTLARYLAVGGGNQGSSASWGEYVMSGGTLKIASESTTGNNCGLKLMRCNAGQTTSSQHGVFTQTGGEVTCPRISVGSDTAGSCPRGIQYALFDLKGGLFNLGTKGFSVSPYWNDAGTTNGAYNIRLGGGTLRATGGFTSTCSWDVPLSGTPFTLDAQGGDVRLYAPLWGDGVLRKTGALSLVLADATRFNGTLDVREGSVELLGVPDEPEVPYESWSWVADTAAAGKTNGAAVTSWFDTTGTREAKPDAKNSGLTWYEGHADRKPWNIGNPTVSNGMFNGHAALRFSGRAIISVPKEANPLAGNTNLTMMVVYRPNGGNTKDKPWIYGSGTLVGGADAGYGHYYAYLQACSGGKTAGGARNHGGGTGIGAATRDAYAANDGKVHVATLSVDGWTLTVTLDGVSVTTNRTDQAPAGLFKNLPLHIGGHFPDEANLNCCNAYIAEVRVYPNRVLTYNECLTVTKELLAKYDADPARLVTVGTNTETKDGDVAMTSGLPAAAVPPEPAATESSWRADTLNDTLADGAEVTSWPNESGTVGSEATLALAGSKALKGPTLVKNAMNGRSVLRFDAAEKTALAIPAAAAATSGATDFTAAVVFRSTKSGDGTGEYGTGASAGDGIVGSKQGTSKNDFAITWHREGTAAGCWGTSSCCFVRKPFRLDDGLPHVAALTRDAAGGTYVWMVDGVPQPGTTTSVAALGSFDVLVGALAKEIDNGFFSGDIATVRLWDKAMTREGLKATSERLAWEYGFRLMSPFGHALGGLADRGLAATNVNVAAGATLKLPVSETAPLTLGRDRTFANAGAVEGALALADGATLKLSAYGDQAPAFGVLRLSGTVTFAFEDLPDLLKNPRLKLFSVQKLMRDPGTKIVLQGLDGSSSFVFDETTQEAFLRTRPRTVILIR